MRTLSQINTKLYHIEFIMNFIYLLSKAKQNPQKFRLIDDELLNVAYKSVSLLNYFHLNSVLLRKKQLWTYSNDDKHKMCTEDRLHLSPPDFLHLEFTRLCVEKWSRQPNGRQYRRKVDFKSSHLTRTNFVSSVGFSLSRPSNEYQYRYIIRSESEIEVV